MKDTLYLHEYAHEVHDHDHPDGSGNHNHAHPGKPGREHGQAGHSHVSSHSLSDPSLATREGVQAVKVSLAVLLVTALFQVGVAISSGSVALLADTIHNFADALTGIPLWLAFNLSRRRRNARYTYGYGRAEDLAGAVIVTLIFASALEVFYQSIQKIIHPAPVSNLGWVAAAALVGFLGNELAAILRLRAGRRIHSAALVADGRHSQVDGFTSLGVLAGIVMVRLGIPLADPLIGFAIGVAILAVAWNSGGEIWYRLMDAADPEQTRLIEQTAAIVPGVLGVQNIHLRWLGHWQEAELHIMVDAKLTTSESHQVAEMVRHELFHALERLQEINVHVDPFEEQPGPAHALTAHHGTN